MEPVPAQFAGLLATGMHVRVVLPHTMVGAGRRGNVLEGNYSVSWTGANYLQEIDMWIYVTATVHGFLT